MSGDVLFTWEHSGYLWCAIWSNLITVDSLTVGAGFRQTLLLRRTDGSGNGDQVSGTIFA